MAFMKRITVIFLLLSIHAPGQRAVKNPNYPGEKTPALVVGIVVDQMRFDYLYRFQSKYSDGGFRRLLNEGFLFSNANYTYVPTNTAPGHACIYTGATPSVNGIINNEWYDRNQRKTIYCVGDTGVKPVGTTSISGKMSPRNLLTTTVTDELRLATNMESKVIGIALKDRGAILPGGNMANAAYWHDPYSNNWVTSNYYMNALPKWVTDFNTRNLVDTFLSQKWSTLLPVDQYVESSEDDTPYEGLFEGETKPVFPHDLPKLKAVESELIRSTPFGNSLTKEFAIEAVKGEQLGRGRVTDFLAISFSSTDYVGHMYGTNSVELEDTYLRLDRDLESLFKFLDEWTGKNYVLFLTGDHGAPNNPGYALDHKLKAGNMNNAGMSDSLKEYIRNMFGTDSLILSASSHNIFLDRQYIEEKKLNLSEIQQACASYVTKFKGVAVALTATELSLGVQRSGLYSFIQNGYHSQRSADVMIQLQSGWIDWYKNTGTTHGSAYSYDTHVPLIFTGRGIKPGSSDLPVSICDIAPTLSSLLNIEFPSGNTGVPLTGYLK
jgi:predicted AlkP superfamily pyrophosphatase or phosphodiesterase